MTSRKTALITGANRGIGYEVARRLVQEGYHVMGTYRSEKTVTSLDQQVDWVHCDITDADMVRECARYIEQNFPSLDVLVNNSGIMDRSSMSDGDIETIRQCMDVNLYGAIRMTVACLPALKRSHDPRVINVTSEMGHLNSLLGGYAGYRLSKAALNAHTILMANEQPDIKINAVCPGWVRTDMGGSSAPGSVSDAADRILWMISTDRLESGMFYTNKRVIPW